MKRITKLKIEHGKTYVDGDNYKIYITKRPEGHQTVWEFEDQFHDIFDVAGVCFEGSPQDHLVREYVVDLPRPDGNKTTLADLEADVEGAKKNCSSLEFCFTWVTVESLINKIKQLEGLS